MPVDHAMTSTALPRPPTGPTHDVMTSMVPRPPPMDNVLTSAVLRPPAVLTHDTLTSPLFTEQPHIHMPLHTFARPLELTGIHSTVTSALSRPPAAPGDDDIIQRPAASSYLPTADYTMQRPADRLDIRNMYTNVEQLLTDSSRLPPMATQPLWPDSIDTLFHGSVPCLPAVQPTAHQYQNISATLSLPTVSTRAHAPTYVGAPQCSYTENSQSLPIAVEQAGLSNFTHVDVQHSRPAVVDSIGQHYTICTPAGADAVRPIVTAYTPPLPSPSVHWRKRFAYDYIQPDTGMGASTHIAPAVHSGYIRPHTSDTHTDTHTSVNLHTLSVGAGQSMTDFRPPQAPPSPSSYVPHGHIMPPQVPTVPSAVPPPSHLPFQVPISSPSATNMTYLHVPHTHTVFADVHALFTHV